MHEIIREEADRSHTARLLALLATAPEGEELGEIAWTLERLADPRSLAPLTALLEDPAAPLRARQAAGSVLRSTGWTAPRAARRAWWRSGDPILERHALLLMDRGDAEIVEAVAADPRHRHHREAIDALAFGFEERRFQDLKIRALTHPDPRVREAACDTLLWDEPVAAEPLLLLTTADADDRVAEAAINTLRYYASRRVLQALDELRRSPRPSLAPKAEEAFAELQGTFESALERADEAARPRLASWMAPVWSLLTFEPDPTPTGPLLPSGAPLPSGPDSPAIQGRHALPPPAPPRLAVGAIEAMLANLDGPWATKLERLRSLARWSYDPDERRRLTALFLAHEDPEVRAIACPAFAAWSDPDSLLRLLGDPMFIVVKTATYWLGKIEPRTARVAERCWQRLHEAETSGTHAYEALAAYAAHAPRREAVPRLVQLVRHDERPSVRREAISQLVLHGAAGEIASLLDLLAEAPISSWSVHRELLSAALDLGLPVDPPPALRAADEAWMQSTLARLPGTDDRMTIPG
jgi:HEAT repeat protein